MARRALPSQRYVLVALCALAAFGLGIWLRLPLQPDLIINVDELIPLAVSQSMTALGKLDPNWRHADLPEFFRYDQYNFYFFNILSHVSINIGDNFDAERLTALRVANIIYQLTAVVLLIDGARRYCLSNFANGALAFSIIAAPTFVHDALMARPESLLYLVTGLAFWVSSLSLGLLVRVGLVSFVLGVGAAVKITYPVIGVAGILALILLSWPGWRVAACAGAVALVGLAAGFGVSAPYALLNFDVFLNGLSALSNQYDSAHPPHSHPDPWVLTYFFWICRFFAELYWPWFLLIGAGIILGDRRERTAIVCLAAPFLLLVVYFSTKTVFFERNFAHAMPLLFVASALSFQILARRIAKPLAGLALTILVLPALFWSMQIAQAGHHEGDVRDAFVQANGLEEFQMRPTGETLLLVPPPACGDLAVTQVDHVRTRRYEAMLLSAGFKPVATYRGPFDTLATSTLQSYLGYSMGFYTKPCTPARASES